MKRERTRKQELWSVLAFLQVAAFSAHAQQAEQTGALEEIVVTGSYLGVTAGNRPSPVTVLDNQEIERANVNSIAEIFKQLPEAVGSISTTSFAEGDNSPTNTINLRGLGPRATLVLLNGRRQTVDASADNDGLSAVDVNNLAPAIMIERIEVVTDGSSALYGSDAVAGVANFVTRNDFEGVELRSNALWDEDGIGTMPNYSIQGIFGADGVNTHIVAGFEWTSTESILVEDRFNDFEVSETLSSIFGNPGNFQPADANGPPPRIAQPDPLCGDPSLADGIEAGFIGPTGLCTMGTGLGRGLLPDKERLNGLAVVTREFPNDITAQVEIGFSRSRANSPWGFGLPDVQSPRPLVPANNPGVIAANAADPSFEIQDYRVLFRPRTPFGGDPVGRASQIFDQDTFRLAGAVDGPLAETGWDYSVTGTFSNNDTRFRDDEPIRERLLLALQGFGGPACDPASGIAGVGDCQFWNPFANAALAQPGDPAANDEALFEWFNAGREILGEAQLTTFDLVLKNESLFELPGGPTGFAIGAQWRQQEFSQDFDQISNDGGFSFNSQAFPDFGGTTESKAGFWELSLLPTSWGELQVAGRFESTESEDSYDSKVGFVVDPPFEALQGMSIRASWGTSFRAPSETQLFGSGPGDTPNLRLGETGVIQARGQLSGDEDLKPEESTSYSVGISWILNQYVTLDAGYWRFEFKDLIVSQNADAVLLRDMADGFIDGPEIVLFPGSPNEVCEVTGKPLDRPECVDAVDIAVADLRFVNESELDTSGIDLGLDFTYDGFGGEWSASIQGSWIKDFDITSGGRKIDGVGVQNSANAAPPTPEFRVNSALRFSRGNHFGQIDVHFVDKVKEDEPEDVLTEEDSMTTVDLQYQYTLPFLNGRSSVTASVTNLFDEKPPLADNNLIPVESIIYDQRSRRWGLAWKVAF